MEVHMYHKRIESLGELHEVIDALETLGKEYKVVKKIEWTGGTTSSKITEEGMGSKELESGYAVT